MCGRYAFYMPPHKLKDMFGTENLSNFPPRYNCAPLQDLPVIIRNRMGIARWGFLPPWGDEDDKSLAAKMINMRSETAAGKPSFQESWAKARRCIVPANGFFEWKKTESGKQAYYIYEPGNECLAFAGLWSKTGSVVTFGILTKEADGDIADVHHRMPVLVDIADASRWFTATNDEAANIISLASARKLRLRPVGAAVGNIKNDDETLLDEVTNALSAASQGSLAV